MFVGARNGCGVAFWSDIIVLPMVHLNCTMLYFVVQKGDQSWAGLLAYTMLCCAMLLRGMGRMSLNGGLIPRTRPATAYIWWSR
jgi:hypothetical protein